MNRIPLARRIENASALLCPVQRELFLLPVKTLCDFMAQEMGQQDYLAFYDTYLHHADPAQTVSQTVRKARKLLWDHEYCAVAAPKEARIMAQHALELLLVRPFLAAAQQENKQQ